MNERSGQFMNETFIIAKGSGPGQTEESHSPQTQASHLPARRQQHLQPDAGAQVRDCGRMCLLQTGVAKRQQADAATRAPCFQLSVSVGKSAAVGTSAHCCVCVKLSSDQLLVFDQTIISCKRLLKFNSKAGNIHPFIHFPPPLLLCCRSPLQHHK